MIFNVLIFISIVVGIGLIVFSVINFNPKEEGLDSFNTNLDTDRALEKLAISINDADNAIDELSKLSQNIFDEINTKYQELLYLYSFIDEKQKELSLNYEKVDLSVSNDLHILGESNSQSTVTNLNNKHKEILSLYNKGMSVSEIAKALNLGQGEVKLIIDLGKDR